MRYIATLNRLRGYQVSEESKRKMTLSLVDDASKVGRLQIKYISPTMRHPAFKARLDRLGEAYRHCLGNEQESTVSV